MSISKETINQKHSVMNTTELQSNVIRCYQNLRQAIINAEKHPNDELYEMGEMHAADVYDEALIASFLAETEERSKSEESGELPF